MKPVARFKETPEDFCVDEIPAYEPTGEGEHLWLTIRKRNRTTWEVVRTIASQLGCDLRQTGIAGQKDKRAIATQSVTLLRPPSLSRDELRQKAEALTIDGVEVTRISFHANKLKPGHLRGNSFRVCLRGIDATEAPSIEGALRDMSNTGFPNHYDAQRFGRAGDNVQRTLAWLRGEERAPSDRKKRQFLFSSLQSEVFNRVLDARVAEGTWATALQGDLCKLHASGGMFLCENEAEDQARALAGELSATGPMFGVKMREPKGRPLEIERATILDVLGSDFDLLKTAPLGEGTRRPLRIWVEDMHTEVCPGTADNASVTIDVRFMLPKGAYATTLLGQVMTLSETGQAGEVGVLESTASDEERTFDD